MNVLITNDDGYGAWGIEALIKEVSKKHNVFVIAPDGNRSGNSMHISFCSSVELYKKAASGWACSGTPADCVSVGLKSDILGAKIDVVLSGINKGQNIGTDTLYSGTCGAAKLAVLTGVPGIALSLQITDFANDGWNDRSKWHFEGLASFAAENLEYLSSLCRVSDKGKMAEERCAFINVNAFSFESYKGVKNTDVCFREYLDDKTELEKLDADGNKILCKFSGGEGSNGMRSYSDIEACREGYISVSRVIAEPICANEGINLDSIVF